MGFALRDFLALLENGPLAPRVAEQLIAVQKGGGRSSRRRRTNLRQTEGLASRTGFNKRFGLKAN
jgi:hypothetical protein